MSEERRKGKTRKAEEKIKEGRNWKRAGKRRDKICCARYRQREEIKEGDIGIREEEMIRGEKWWVVSQ